MPLGHSRSAVLRYGPLARGCTGRCIAVILLAVAVASSAAAQSTSPDTAATLTVLVRDDTRPIPGAIVRSGRIAAQTGPTGEATLRLAAGTYTIIAARIGFIPDSATITLAPAATETLTIQLQPAVAEIERVVVSATRSERRVEDTPLRVEVIDEEEIAEKVAMTPGDIAMMLNETSGLRVQTTSPSLGAASVRIQGLSGRHSLILADGLPLYGGQGGGLGLLQIPPVDLGRVEVIKGTASALYGSAALGGVINLLSRRPGDEAEHTVLVNQTTRGGTDAVAFLSGPLSDRLGYTLLAGAHRQSQRDLDDDGWTDLPGYERVVVRPRFHFDDSGWNAFMTAGFTGEDRDGGTLPGRTAPDGEPFAEGLTTRRMDVGGLARRVIGGEGRLFSGSILTLRGSAVEQRHSHQFGTVQEDDRHRTWFAEAAITVPRGRATYVAGAAYQQDVYRAEDVPRFDYTYTVPAVFAQVDLDPASWISLSTSARLDAHSDHGTSVNPRVSLLLRRPDDGLFAGWTSRLSAGTGEFAPTPFTEETEATGLTPVLVPVGGLVPERAVSGSFDVGGPLDLPFGRLELNATAFGSRVRHQLGVIDVFGTTPSGARYIGLRNAPDPTRTWGGELLARLVHELGEPSEAGEEPAALRVTGTYTYLRSRECVTDGRFPGPCPLHDAPLTPRHAAGVVASVEQEGVSRIGLEVYYTGRQALDDNPYRDESRPYVLLGLLGERAFETARGTARVFLNLENLTNVRQTRYDSLLLPARGSGGRWTTDAWTDLTGFTANGGVRFTF